MTDVNSQPTRLEDISSRLLTGAMVTVLGGAVAGVIAWQMVAQLSGWLPDLKALSAGLPPVDFQAMTASERRGVIWDGVNGTLLIAMSVGFMRFGVRLVRTNLLLLQARQRQPKG